MAAKTSFDDVYEVFLSKIEDVELAKLDANDYSETLRILLNSALAMMELDGVKLKEDYSVINEDNEEFQFSMSRIEIEIISLFMICAWYDSKINSIEHVLLFVGANGEKWTDQVNHLNGLKAARDDYYIRATHLVRNFNYRNNSYFD